jgi:hypothetical protein
MLYATVFVRDFLMTASIPMRVLRPDGSPFAEGTVDGPPSNYVASYWFFPLALPPNAQPGEWKLEADFGGTTTRTTFHVGPALPPIVAAVEYYHAGMDHYMVTATPDEIAFLDGGAFGGVWQRTGRTFNVYASPADGLMPVCRYFSASFAPKGSHFYSASPYECGLLVSDPAWAYEGIRFYVPVPDAQGTCPAGTSPIYRLWNANQGGAPNHRFTTDYATQLLFTGSFGWLPEGPPGVGVTMCSPLGV